MSQNGIETIDYVWITTSMKFELIPLFFSIFIAALFGIIMSQIIAYGIDQKIICLGQWNWKTIDLNVKKKKQYINIIVSKLLNIYKQILKL